MSTRARAIGAGNVRLVNLGNALRRRAAIIERWSTQPVLMEVDASTGVAAVAAAAQVGDVNLFLSGAGVPWATYQTTALTLFPRYHADGLIISGDLVDNEAVEYVPGENTGRNMFGCTVGTDEMLFRCNIKIADVSGSDQFLVGWRKQEAFAVPTSFLSTGDGVYTDFYGIGFASAAANPNNVYVAHDLNNSGSTTTGDTLFNWADGENHELTVIVQANGKPLVMINGVVLGDTVKKDGLGATITAQATKNPTSFTFDSGDFLVPFVFIRHDTTTPGVFNLREYAVGPRAHFRAAA